MDKKLVVVVLGNRLNDDGSITEIQKQRLELALEIEEQFKPYCYILSGGPANPVPGKSEALAMYEYLLEKGISKDRLILEDQSYSTVQNAKNSVPIVKELGADILMICTSLYHLANPGYKAMETFGNELEGSNIVLMSYAK